MISRITRHGLPAKRAIWNVPRDDAARPMTRRIRCAPRKDDGATPDPHVRADVDGLPVLLVSALHRAERMHQCVDLHRRPKKRITANHKRADVEDDAVELKKTRCRARYRAVVAEERWLHPHRYRLADKCTQDPRRCSCCASRVAFRSWQRSARVLGRNELGSNGSYISPATSSVVRSTRAFSLPDDPASSSPVHCEALNGGDLLSETPKSDWGSRLVRRPRRPCASTPPHPRGIVARPAQRLGGIGLLS